MSAKNLDNKGRYRSKTVAFRVSPEEWDKFEIAVKLSGLTKQDYLSKRIAERDIVVQGNPRVYKALRDELAKVLMALQDKETTVNDELLETINLITITLQGLKNEE
ncbi:MAG: hypothetical protein RR967_03325 [Anaerovoracaceae bacterium]